MADLLEDCHLSPTVPLSESGDTLGMYAKCVSPSTSDDGSLDYRIAALEETIEKQAKIMQMDQEHLASLEAILAAVAPSTAQQSKEAAAERAALERKLEASTEQLRAEELARQHAEEQLAERDKQLQEIVDHFGKAEDSWKGVLDKCSRQDAEIPRLQHALECEVRKSASMMERVKQEESAHWAAAERLQKIESQLVEETSHRRSADAQLAEKDRLLDEKEEKMRKLYQLLEEERSKQCNAVLSPSTKENEIVPSPSRRLCPAKSPIRKRAETFVRTISREEDLEKDRVVCELQRQLSSELQRRSEAQSQLIQAERQVCELKQQLTELSRQQNRTVTAMQQQFGRSSCLSVASSSSTLMSSSSTPTTAASGGFQRLVSGGSTGSAGGRRPIFAASSRMSSPGKRTGTSGHHCMRKNHSGLPTVLCAALIVPDENESNLTMRSNAWRQSEAQPIDLYDLNGHVILTVSSRRKQIGGTADVFQGDCSDQSLAPSLTLRAAKQKTPLAVGRLGCSPHGHRSMFIYTSDDVLFGYVRRDVVPSSSTGRPDGNGDLRRYILEDRHTLALLATFERIEGRTTVRDGSSSEVMAELEPFFVEFDAQNSYDKLRVLQNVDVGLVLCGLLSMSWLDSDA
eukprot:TRINITY_DN27588_c0_g1_i1.p1 TRINITY_DN27588_c0_g1~~TRINITY_DN27588_c0_g1_i1.p1  ORF type:complete len:630 (-),score=133.02 TRINITY_DN27588_c0_g1_i1:182-2071(-)